MPFKIQDIEAVKLPAELDKQIIAELLLLTPAGHGLRFRMLLLLQIGYVLLHFSSRP